MTGQVRVPPDGEQPAGGGVRVDEGASRADSGESVEVGAQELASLRSQLEERTGDLQRITAEYTNYRRRVERDRQAATVLAKAQVAGELLTVLDDIDRAEAHGDLSGTFKAVADKLVAGLVAHGLESFGMAGDGFDPDVHEAVQHSTSPDVREPTVTTVLRRGYRFGERVLRPAMVVVTDAEPADIGAGAAPEPTSRDAARFDVAGSADADAVAGSPGADAPGAGSGAASQEPGPAQPR
ncbi:MAG TPA: nucleotide exchange factor GrpE [Pseudonocardiaceae bacterium]